MPDNDYGELNPSRRLLMGPGPSDAHPRVLRAMSTPLLGHLDPEFLALMEESKTLLRSVFGTQNELTIPVSATGSAGMEAAFVNVVEPTSSAAAAPTLRVSTRTGARSSRLRRSKLR